MNGTNIEIAWELNVDEPHIYFCISRTPYGPWDYAGKIVYDAEKSALELFDRHNKTLAVVPVKDNRSLLVDSAKRVVMAEALHSYSKWDG